MRRAFYPEISDLRKKDKKYSETFDMINIGEMFEQKGIIFIKVDSSHCAYAKLNGTELYNALAIINGMILKQYFLSDDMVYPLKVELVINEVTD